MRSSTESTAYVVEMDELDEDLCWWLVARTRVGRAVFVVDGEPGVLPVTCVVLDHHQIAFRTGAHSTLGMLPPGTPVVFEFDHADVASESAWSVIVKGHLWPVTDKGELICLVAFELRPWAPGLKDRWMKVVATAVTGREINRHRA